MPRIVISDAAKADLDTLVRTHSLPSDTRERVKHILKPLEHFPEMGSPLSGRWTGSRFLLGPWSWMIIVYQHLADLDLVAITTIQDARRASAATGWR